ncbi:unnamed protein product [Heligmosomoides polygyrus]|uniref:Uncharacterized protein n=1 Tax=Heligmosomoides polygyrus TaxID=6339 RepID=A0A183FU53_HELPZ|nr:unnamed protein product [Heligmosomoides polygyrus]
MDGCEPAVTNCILSKREQRLLCACASRKLMSILETLEERSDTRKSAGSANASAESQMKVHTHGAECHRKRWGARRTVERASGIDYRSADAPQRAKRVEESLVIGDSHGAEHGAPTGERGNEEWRLSMEFHAAATVRADG